MNSSFPLPFIFYRYILKEHIAPFFFALSLIVFIFLMNFTLREAARLFGRGLDTIIIAKMFYYHLAPTLSLAIPMSVLVSTSMAFVRIATDSEITIIKSSGINLVRIMIPIVFVSILIAMLTFYFNNTVLPKYNLEYSNLLRELRRLKPTAAIYEKTFTDIENIKLYVDKLDDNFNKEYKKKVALLGEDVAQYPVDHMFGVIIYDNQNPQLPRTIVAKEGFVYLHPQKKVFEFILMEGEIYERKITLNKKNNQFQHSFFQKTIFLLGADQYILDDKKNDIENKSSRQKTTEELSNDIQKEEKFLTNNINKVRQRFYNSPLMAFSESYKKNEKPRQTPSLKISSEQVHKFALLYSSFKRDIKHLISDVASAKNTARYTKRRLDDLKGEWHKKYAISLASIIFALIGAPLGMTIKKGDSGTSSFICLLVFIIYYICLILGEDLSEDGKIPAWLGLWSGNIFGGIITLVGFLLLRKDRSISDFLGLAYIKSLFSFLKKNKAK